MVIPLGISGSAAQFSPKERLFLVEEKILIKNLPKEAENLSVWVPYPVSNNWQVIEDFKLTAPFKADVIIDNEYGNKIFIIK